MPLLKARLAADPANAAEIAIYAKNAGPYADPNAETLLGVAAPGQIVPVEAGFNQSLILRAHGGGPPPTLAATLTAETANEGPLELANAGPPEDVIGPLAPGDETTLSIAGDLIVREPAGG